MCACGSVCEGQAGHRRVAVIVSDGVCIFVGGWVACRREYAGCHCVGRHVGEVYYFCLKIFVKGVVHCHGCVGIGRALLYGGGGALAWLCRWW